MSGEEPFSGDGGERPGDEEDIEKKRKEIEQRERGLDDFADELDEREESLEERARELDQREGELDEREEMLDQRETRIQEREAELDERETGIEERESQLSKRAEELDEKEATVREFVGDNVREAVEESFSNITEGYGKSSRLGTIGSLVLGLVGVMLIVAGVLNGFATSVPSLPVFEGGPTDTANLVTSILLIFSGLAANLAAVAD